MIWNAPSIEILSLQVKNVQPNDLFEFQVDGTGFREGVTQLVFVRALIEADDGLKSYQVIPCMNLKVDPGGADAATFLASLHERDGGAYHLVACNPPNGNVNQADVLEYAIAIAALPGKPVHVEVNAGP